MITICAAVLSGKILACKSTGGLLLNSHRKANGKLKAADFIKMQNQSLNTKVEPTPVQETFSFKSGNENVFGLDVDKLQVTTQPTLKRQITGGPNGASLRKRNRKEVHQRRCADEFAEEPDTPTPSNGSIAKKSRKVDVKKGKKKADAQQFPDSPGSRSESPVEKEAETQVTDKLQAQPRVDVALCDKVKRLSRDELERVVMGQMCLAIRERDISAELERKLEASDAQVAQLERYRRNSEALLKQISNALKTPHMPELKSSVTVALATTEQPISTSPPTEASATIISPTGSNNLVRIPIPPSFTMQSLDIASYVPQRESDQGSPSYVNFSGKSTNNNSMASKLLRSSVNITPAVPLGANQRPQAEVNPDTVKL